LLRGLGLGRLGNLAGQGGIGWNIGGLGGEIGHPDVRGLGQFAGHELLLAGDLSRGAAGG
jgi:hypothetical protein